MTQEAKSSHCASCGSGVPFLEEECPECGGWQSWSYMAPCPGCDRDVDHQYRSQCPFCSTALGEWNVVIQHVLSYDFHTDVVVSKKIAHPTQVGFKEAGALPKGQKADYRFRLDDDTEIHVKDHENHYLVHRDKCTADIPVGHLLQDAPVATAVGGFLLYRFFSE